MSNDIKRVKLFYILMCLAGFLIILLPVGIANFVFGYIFQDSPCTLCWGQRESMIFIGLIALFIVRYGLKPRYIAMMLLIAIFGMFQSFIHFGLHAHRDLSQGLGIAIFGIHTYFWAEVVFWCVILVFGILFFIAPKLSKFEEELAGEKFRPLKKCSRIMFIICAVVIGSNLFQAFVSTGIPPFYGQGDPVRFTLNPKYIIWSDKGLQKNWKKISFLGKRDVASPDYAFAPASQKLGISFDNEIKNSPFKDTNQTLKIIDEKKLNISQPINTLNFVDNLYIASSKYNVYYLNQNFKTVDEFELDPYFSATIDPIVGIISYAKDKFVLMGSNKTFLKFNKNPKADEVLQYADFIKGANHFEGQGKGLGRARVVTIRSKFNHIASMTNDDKYLYLATVPNNQDKKSFVISKVLIQDGLLSAEFTPKADLKDGKTLGDLYITSMSYKDGLIYMLSKNHNVIAVLDPKKEGIVNTISYPSNIKNARAIFFKDGKINILSYQNNENLLFVLE